MPGMISLSIFSMSQVKGLPGRVQALARSTLISAGRVPKPMRRWKPRSW